MDNMDERRERLIQTYKDELEKQKQILQERYDKIKTSTNPYLDVVKRQYAQVFMTIGAEVQRHLSQLDLILSHIKSVLEEDEKNIDLKKEEQFIAEKKREFEQIKQSLEKILV